MKTMNSYSLQMIAFVVMATALAGACKKSAVDPAEKLRNSICACNTKECIDRQFKEQAKSMGMPKDRARAERMFAEAQACAQKVYDKTSSTEGSISAPPRPSTEVLANPSFFVPLDITAPEIMPLIEKQQSTPHK